MSKGARLRLESLKRFLFYVLAHRPDEFGLVPNEDGFVQIKELLQALHEEEGWRYVRRSHIREMLLDTVSSGVFEADDTRIRTLERYWDFDFTLSSPFPSKVMFSPVRKKAHAHVLEKGLSAPEGRPIVLSPDKKMAQRVGSRKDHNPVLIQVSAAAARENGAMIYRLGQLFLAREIPPEFIMGPPLKKSEIKKIGESREKLPKDKPMQEPGTFVLDQAKDPDLLRRMKGKKRRGWKEEARKMRRRKKNHHRCPK